MKTIVLLVAFFSLHTFADPKPPKHDGFLKKTSDAVLLLIGTNDEGHCYALLAKEGKVQLGLTAPTMLINKTSVETKVKKLISRTSNREFDIKQVEDLIEGVVLPNGDIAGSDYTLKTKKLTGMTFCAKDKGIADSQGYWVEVTVGNKWGALEIPAQSFSPCCGDNR